jgi:hypothetical protein
MRSKLFKERPKRLRISAEKWLQVLPDAGDGYALFDVVSGAAIGRILVDEADNWIYDGSVLNVDEQEEVAVFITGSQKEMNELIKNL